MPKKARSSPKKDTKKVRFELFAPDAQKVMVSGDFNQWSLDALPMKKDRKGVWKASIDLPPGRYEYRFWVDGAWCDDPRAEEMVPNVFGTYNCVRVVV